MVGVNNVAHDDICECFEGIMLEPCLLQPCVHVAGPGLIGDRVFREICVPGNARVCGSGEAI